MEPPQLEAFSQVSSKSVTNSEAIINSEDAECISIETEIPEALYKGMKEFIGVNPQWDQYRVMSSALANFLFQSGSNDRAVTERYLSDLFKLPDF